jgi:hypothetical protein
MTTKQSSNSLTDIVFGVVGILLLLLIALWIGVKVFDTKPLPDRLAAKIVLVGDAQIDVEYHWTVDSKPLELAHPTSRRTRRGESFLAFSQIDRGDKWELYLTPTFQIITGNYLTQAARRIERATPREPELDEFRQLMSSYYQYKALLQSAQSTEETQKVASALLATCRRHSQDLSKRLAGLDKHPDGIFPEVFEYVQYRIQSIQHQLEVKPPDNKLLTQSKHETKGKLSTRLILLDEAGRDCSESFDLLIKTKVWKDCDSDAAKLDERILARALQANLDYKSFTTMYRCICNEFMRCRIAKEYCLHDYASAIPETTLDLLLKSGAKDPLLQVLRIELEAASQQKREITVTLTVKIGELEELTLTQTRVARADDSGVKTPFASIQFTDDKTQPAIKFYWSDN